MQLAISFRNLSLSVATASFLLAGAAFAEQSSIVGVNARLDHTISSGTATDGQIVAVKLDRPVKTVDGVDLPRGTQLEGTITHVQASANGGPASVSLVFNKAQLKDGKQIPVKVTLLGAYPPGQMQASNYGDEEMGPAPRHVNPRERILQEPGMLSHVSMISSVQGQNSATFRKKDGNFSLHAGTYFQLGIGLTGIQATHHQAS